MCDKSRGRFEVDCEVVPTFLDDAPRTFLLIVEMRRSVCGLDSRPVQSLSFAGFIRKDRIWQGPNWDNKLSLF